MHRDGRARLVALGEVISLEHSGHGGLGCQTDHARGAKGLAPLGIAANVRFLGVEHEAGLLEVGLGIGRDVFGGEGRTGGIAAGGVSDERREVADQEDDLVAKVLKLTQLVEHHRVAQVKVWRGRVQAQLDP